MSTFVKGVRPLFCFFLSAYKTGQPTFVSLLLVSLLLSGCASRQTVIDELATQYHFQRSVVRSKSQFSHLLYTNRAYQSALNANPKPVLHVYLEGDGIPWIRPSIVAVDPTPKTPMALNLMRVDDKPGLYLGRPCYHGYFREAACNPLLWTHARYSQPVLNSMLDAILQKLQQDRWKQTQITLIGYSGGGVLALLLADRLQNLPRINQFASIRVVSVAANLDVAAWARLHGYSPLRYSIDPATIAEHFVGLQQHHFYGLSDQNVPPSTIDPIKSRFGKQAHWYPMRNVDHACCWVELWPDLLTRFE